MSLVAVEYTAPYGRRAVGDRVRVDPGSAKAVVDAGVAVYVDEPPVATDVPADPPVVDGKDPEDPVDEVDDLG